MQTKFFSLMCCVLLTLGLYAQDSNNKTYGTHASQSDFQPKSIQTVGSFPHDSIKMWCGQGTNEATIIIGWEDDGVALVWGVRWSGSVVAIDLYDSIATYDSRFTYSMSGSLVTNFSYSGSDYTLPGTTNWWCYYINGDWAGPYDNQAVANGDVLESSDDCSWSLTINDAVAATNPNPRAIITVNYNDHVCQGDDYEGYGFSIQNVMADTVLTDTASSATADTIKTLNLAVIMPVYGTDSATIAKGESYTWNGKVYTETGTYVDTLPSSEGCDSIATLHLTVTDEPTGLQDVAEDGAIVETNPVRVGQKIVLNCKKECIVEVVAANGAILSTKAVRAGRTEINAIETAGVYFLRITDTKGNTSTERLIVVK